MNQQKLIIITGSPCVGKTTVTEKLFESYEIVHTLMGIGLGV